jgi:hypothetical protein
MTPESDRHCTLLDTRYPGRAILFDAKTVAALAGIRHSLSFPQNGIAAPPPVIPESGNPSFSVIPAKAEPSPLTRHSPESGNPAPAFSVIPAKAGIQHFEVFAAPRGYLLSQV